MRKFLVSVAGLLLILSTPVSAASMPLEVASTPSVFITELQTNGGNASQEFIELYNATDADIDFSNGASQWRMQFFNSTAVKQDAPAWDTQATSTNSVILTGVIKAHGYYILASDGYQPAGILPNSSYTPSSSHLMTDTGGGLQLLTIKGYGTTGQAAVAIDRTMWLSDPVAMKDIAPSPKPGKSLQRSQNDQGEYAMAAGVSLLEVQDDITPLSAWVAPEPEPMPTPSEDDSQVVGHAADDGQVKPLITELLPNPGAPLSDANDEFIELYNPNNDAFDLTDYKLDVGTTSHRLYAFPAGESLAPQSYTAFYAAKTHLALSNNGSKVALRDADDNVVAESGQYGPAADNQSWSLIGSTWQWTTSATPNAPNVEAAPAPIVKAAKPTTKTSTTSKKAVTVKTAAAKKATTKKTTAKKATTKKAATKKSKTGPISTAAALTQKPPVHTTVLVGVAVAAVIYGLYEYREDISNKFFEFRTNRSHRRRNGDEVAWRRGYSSEQ